MRLFVISLMLCVVVVCQARNVTIRAVDQPAPEVVRSIAGQTGKNFVYPSELLRDMRGVGRCCRQAPERGTCDNVWKH